MSISREDYVKYPFIKEASDYVSLLGLNISDLDKPEYLQIAENAEQRVFEALVEGIVNSLGFTEIDILSFPVAVLFVKNIGDNFLKRRYALAEAKRAYELLNSEDNKKLVEIAHNTFNWDASLELGVLYLGFIDYLRNSTNFHDDRWKLINQLLINGKVQLNKEDFTRLLQEEIRRRIENIIERSPKVELQPLLLQRVNRINQKLAERKVELRIDELPKTAVSSAYPPCIRQLYDALLSGQHISHMGRFTLTSFLLNVGINVNELTKLYTSASDFNEELTRYQVKHIAGETGSRIKYNPPKCNTLKTHGLCPGSDNICAKAWHPLNYYSIKLTNIKKPSSD